MNGNSSNMCRFCLHEEKCDDLNKVVDIFNNELDNDLPEKILNYTQIRISPNDEIPPKICINCVDSLVKFDNFLDRCWNSKTVLEQIFFPNKRDENMKSERSKSQISNETNVNSALEISENMGNSNSEEAVNDSDSNDSPNEVKKIKVRNMITTNNTYMCTICTKSFKSFFEYQDHRETHNGQLVSSCTKCNQLFSEGKQRVEHDVNHKIACPVCNKMVLPKSLQAHLRKHTDFYRSGMCNLSRTSKAALEKHANGRHNGKKSLACYVCGKKSSCQVSLNRHSATHTSNTLHKCDFCDFSAKSPNVLKVHMSRKHQGVQQICIKCGKKFKSEVSLKQHVKRMHNPQKYNCKVCQKEFSHKYILKKHIMTKHPKKRFYECKVCGEDFQTIKKLKDHMYSHKQGCVVCKSCGKQFFYKKYLEKHMEKCGSNKEDDSTKGLSRLKSTISLPASSLPLETFSP